MPQAQPPKSPRSPLEDTQVINKDEITRAVELELRKKETACRMEMSGLHEALKKANAEAAEDEETPASDEPNNGKAKPDQH